MDNGKNTGGDDAEITHIPLGLICHNENHAPVCLILYGWRGYHRISHSVPFYVTQTLHIAWRVDEVRSGTSSLAGRFPSNFVKIADCPQIIQLEPLFTFTNGWRKSGFVGRSSTPGSDPMWPVISDIYPKRWQIWCSNLATKSYVNRNDVELLYPVHSGRNCSFDVEKLQRFGVRKIRKQIYITKQNIYHTRASNPFHVVSAVLAELRVLGF